MIIRLSLIFILALGTIPVLAQNIIAAKPAYLEVFAQKSDGTEGVITSEKLSVTYDKLLMSGELDLETCRTTDPLLIALLDSAMEERLTFSALIPEGKFVFGNTVEEKFSVETDLRYGERQSRIILDFVVSNRKTSSANTFMITVIGSLLLKEDLGMERETGIENKIQFRFSQNVSTRTY